MTPLGDAVHAALSAVGVTPERVERWLGRPCGCDERREKLNRLTAWARRIVAGRTERAADYLATMMGHTDGGRE